jgi:hypothetical protein
MRWRGTTACAAVLLVAACAGGPGGGSETFWCSGEPVPAGVLENGATAESLEHAEALAGHEVPVIDPAEWIVLSESDENVALIRELDEPEDLGAGDVRTHELLAIAWVDAANLDPSPAWVLDRHSSCALAVDAGTDGGAATVTLDPGAPPDAAATTVHLLVTEQACNSGLDADGRVRVVRLDQGESTIGVHVVVDPREGDQSCPSNPATPFVVELDAPLDGRGLYDVSVSPPRELEMPDRP